MHFGILFTTTMVFWGPENAKFWKTASNMHIFENDTIIKNEYLWKQSLLKKTWPAKDQHE